MSRIERMEIEIQKKILNILRGFLGLMITQEEIKVIKKMSKYPQLLNSAL